MGELLVVFVFFAFVVGLAFIRTVPPNTIQIIDRNTHYLKTKRHGMYFFNPATDKVTTEISRRQITKSYADNFETHDGYIVRVFFSVTYHANDLDEVIRTLSLARRSIDDVMNGSIYWATNNLSIKDFQNKSIVLLSEAKPQLISEASELEITIDGFYINGIQLLPKGANAIPFKPHTSTQSSGPIRFY